MPTKRKNITLYTIYCHILCKMMYIMHIYHKKLRRMKWHFSNELARFVNVSLKFQWAEYPVVHVAGKRNNIHKRIAASLLRDSREGYTFSKKSKSHFWLFPSICAKAPQRVNARDFDKGEPIFYRAQRAGSSSSRNFLLSAQKKICEPFCEIRAK